MPFKPPLLLQWHINYLMIKVTILFAKKVRLHIFVQKIDTLLIFPSNIIVATG